MGRTSDARERLLGSARELFHQRGFNAVGVNDICSAAGVNKGSFYHFFPSKQQLALDVVDAYWLLARQRLESHLLGDEPPLQRLRAFCRSLYDDHRTACATSGVQRGCPLGNLGLEMSTQDPLLRDRVGQAFDAQIGYFERLLRQARQAGDVAADLDPRRTAVSLVALLEGRILLSKVHNDPALLADLEAEALRLVTGGGAG
jgi:TetR/AcrR family transcriptional repressor of nem operon